MSVYQLSTMSDCVLSCFQRKTIIKRKYCNFFRGNFCSGEALSCWRWLQKWNCQLWFVFVVTEHQTQTYPEKNTTLVFRVNAVSHRRAQDVWVQTWAIHTARGHRKPQIWEKDLTQSALENKLQDFQILVWTFALNTMYKTNINEEREKKTKF